MGSQPDIDWKHGLMILEVHIPMNVFQLYQSQQRQTGRGLRLGYLLWLAGMVMFVVPIASKFNDGTERPSSKHFS